MTRVSITVEANGYDLTIEKEEPGAAGDDDRQVMAYLLADAVAGLHRAFNLPTPDEEGA